MVGLWEGRSAARPIACSRGAERPSHEQLPADSVWEARSAGRRGDQMSVTPFTHRLDDPPKSHSKDLRKGRVSIPGQI